LAPQATGQVTKLLHELSEGDGRAREQLIPLVYDELRRRAAAYLRAERPDHTLQATALVHEAYLRLVAQDRVQWRSRAHFFVVAAEMMRRVLVDHARAKLAEKRGGGYARVPLTDAVAMTSGSPAKLLALDRSLARLAAIDPGQSRIVELRVFAGLPVEKVARVTGVSAATVKRDWALAKAWLLRDIRESDYT
jgi:RNA polymerase sigma factor (TIGR02999 family)